MASQIKYCNVECNWTAVERHTIEDIVIFQHENVTPDSATITPHVPPEGCVVEKKDCADDECQITIRCRPPHYMLEVSAVDVLCSAKHMEMYTMKGDYLETSKGVPVQDMEDGSKLQCLQYSMEKPMDSCKIKLKSLASPGRVWFHSVYISLAPAERSENLTGKAFDLSAVKEMLGDTSSLSNGAQQLLASIENQQMTQDPTIPAGLPNDLSSFMSSIKMMQEARASSRTHPQSPVTGGGDDKLGTAATVPPSVASMFAQLNTNVAEIITNADQQQRDSAGNSERNRDIAENFEDFISAKLNAMEIRMMANIEKLIRDSEERISSRLQAMLLNKKMDSLELD